MFPAIDFSLVSVSFNNQVCSDAHWLPKDK